MDVKTISFPMASLRVNSRASNAHGCGRARTTETVDDQYKCNRALNTNLTSSSLVDEPSRGDVMSARCSTLPNAMLDAHADSHTDPRQDAPFFCWLSRRTVALAEH